MPNPFPGMDPYLEGSFWPTARQNLTEEIARQLARNVRSSYVVRVNVREIVTTLGDLENAPADSRLNGISARAEQTFIEIRDLKQRRLIVTIEVLSMADKRGAGLAAFRLKREELLSGSAHYMEIDLLRAGERSTLADAMPSVSYLVVLSRAGSPNRTEIWPVALDHPLPVIPVPLLPGDDDVRLDLQAALTTVYELFHYDRAANHRQALAPPLPAEQAAWADARLRTAGLDMIDRESGL